MDQNTIRTLALASQLGATLAGPFVVFIGGGVLLDRKVHTSPIFLLIGIVIGFIVAGVGLYDIVRHLPTGGRPPPKRPE